MQAHPRAARDGSPPPAWGSPFGLHPNYFEARFTPTRVGKPRERQSPDHHPTVHPHPRGEAIMTTYKWTVRRGSPPPAWGSHRREAPQCPNCRFTPTRVGKPNGPCSWCYAQTVHPHPRGEAVGELGEGEYVVGSPPPAWGSLADPVHTILCLRFTPTRVGKPFRLQSRTAQASVHPHPRGEACSCEGGI